MELFTLSPPASPLPPHRPPPGAQDAGRASLVIFLLQFAMNALRAGRQLASNCSCHLPSGRRHQREGQGEERGCPSQAATAQTGICIVCSQPAGFPGQSRRAGGFQGVPGVASLLGHMPPPPPPWLLELSRGLGPCLPPIPLCPPGLALGPVRR